MKQRSEEWFKARIGRITGSMAGAALGLSKFKTRKKALADMVAEYQGKRAKFDNVATRYGTFAEQHAVAMYELDTGRQVEECGFLTWQDWLGASPDGKIYDTGVPGVLEIKCPYSRFGDADFGKMLPEYYAQVQLEMLCADVRFCDFMQWSPEGYKIQRVAYDRPWLVENVPKLKQFHNEYLHAISLLPG